MRHIVEHYLEGHEDALKEYVIGVEVFERGSSFDPRTDTIVRVDARRLRRKLQQYYSTDGLHDPVCITSEPGSYAPVCSLRDGNGDSLAAPPPTDAVSRIAVAPFLNIGGDPGNDPICDGFTEELINALAQIPELRVTARTSSFLLKSKNLEIGEIGERLKVGLIVEGSVRRADDKLRVTAQLVSVSDGCHLWSAAYDRRIDDLFAIQEEIANRIAGALLIRLSAETRSSLFRGRPHRREAYELCLKGRYFWNRYQPESCWKAIEYFERAIALEPDYALAYAYVAQSFCYLTFLGVRSGNLRQRAEAAARRCLELDATLFDCQMAVGGVEGLISWKGGSAGSKRLEWARELDARQALLNPCFHMFLATTGQVERGLATIRQALEIDPFSMILHDNLGLTLYCARRHEEAIAQLRDTLEMAPDFLVAQQHLGLALAALNRFDEAITLLRKGLARSGSHFLFTGILGHCYASCGMNEEAEQLLAELAEQPAQEFALSMQSAVILSALGRPDEAFERMRNAAEERSSLFLWLRVWALFDNLLADPRARSFLDRTMPAALAKA